MNTHRFTEPAPVIDLAHFRKECGHQHHEDCHCYRELWLGYERWISERELETGDAR